MSEEDVQDEYVYEYDEKEVETFLVDLDLSSLNGMMKSSTPGLRKSLQAPKNGTLGKSRNLDRETESQPHAFPAIVDDDDDELQKQIQSNSVIDMAGNSDIVQKRSAQGTTDEGNLQILEFHSHNPIVSYRNKIYSCAWSDMVGTNLFFSKHVDPPAEDETRDGDYHETLGTSRIRLVGHQAKVSKKVNGKKRGRNTDDEGWAEAMEGDVEPDQLGGPFSKIRYTNPKTNAEIQRQARFLERLMNVKRARGETDTVRTFVPAQTNTANKDQTPRSRDELQKEIERLNRMVVRGDADALHQLQGIYAELEETSVND